MSVVQIWMTMPPKTKGILSPQMTEIHPLSRPAIPPLTALLAFERAATQLSFRRAARDLSLSPSAVSHQIRGLEEQFGIKLFVRGARSVLAMRLAEARRQLESTPLRSIAETALACGFDSLATFYRAFRQTYGMAPGDVREPQPGG